MSKKMINAIKQLNTLQYLTKRGKKVNLLKEQINIESLAGKTTKELEDIFVSAMDPISSKHFNEAVPLKLRNLYFKLTDEVDEEEFDEEYLSDYLAAGTGFPPDDADEEYMKLYYGDDYDDGSDENIEESKSITSQNILSEETKLDKKTNARWNSKSTEEQKKHVDAHPEDLVAKIVKSGQLTKYFEKIGGDKVDRNSSEEQAIKEERLKLTKTPYENLPEEEKEKFRIIARKILALYEGEKKRERRK